MHLEFNVVVI